jgi:hypothetical protein
MFHCPIESRMIIAKLVANFLAPVHTVLGILLPVLDALWPIIRDGSVAGQLARFASQFAVSNLSTAQFAVTYLTRSLANAGPSGAGSARSRPAWSRPIKEIVERALANAGAHSGTYTGAQSCTWAEARSTFRTAGSRSADVKKVLELALAGTGCRAGSGPPGFGSNAAYVGATAADFRAGAGSRTRSRCGSGASPTRADSRTHRRSAWCGTSTTTTAETAPACPATAPAATAAAPSQH